MVLLITGRINSKFIPRVKKKRKAANCIFLTENRICTNKKSPRYCEKCFEASYCTYRIKESLKADSKNNNKTDIVKNYKKVGLWITHNFFGRGEIVLLKGNNAIIRFESGKEVEINLEHCVKNNIIRQRK